MELIIRTYGKLLLEGAVVIAFWLLIFTGVRDGEGHVGFFQLLGSHFEETQTPLGADFSICVQESKRGMPQIFYKKDGALGAGTYGVTELFGAADCEGRELAVQIQAITYVQGTVDEMLYDEAAAQIHFKRSGCYTIQLRAIDAWNNVRISRICVPVN